MSLVLSVATRDAATPFLLDLDAAVTPGAALYRHIADEASHSVQERFVDLAGSNQGVLGHSGFWNRMLSGTQAVADDSAATVRMPREVAQRYFGGTITPKGAAKYLTIPARTEAYGNSARQFDDLRFIKFASGSAALVQREQTQFKRFTKRAKKAGQIDPKSNKEIGGGVFYWLVKSVTQAPDPDVLPTDEDIAAAAIRGVARYMRKF